MNGERPSDDGDRGDQMRIRVPDDVDDESYVRGLRDMAEYLGGIADQSVTIYEDFLDEADEDGRCPECGEELIYNPTSGERECLTNNE